MIKETNEIKKVKRRLKINEMSGLEKMIAGLLYPEQNAFFKNFKFSELEERFKKEEDLSISNLFFSEKEKAELINVVKHKELLDVNNIFFDVKQKRDSHIYETILDLDSFDESQVDLNSYFDPMSYFFEKLNFDTLYKNVSFTEDQIQKIRFDTDSLFVKNKELVYEKLSLLEPIITRCTEQINSVNKAISEKVEFFNDKDDPSLIDNDYSVIKSIILMFRKNKINKFNKELESLKDLLSEKEYLLKKEYFCRLLYTDNNRKLFNMYYVKDYSKEDMQNLLDRENNFGLADFIFQKSVEYDNDRRQYEIYNRQIKIIASAISVAVSRHKDNLTDKDYSNLESSLSESKRQMSHSINETFIRKFNKVYSFNRTIFDSYLYSLNKTGILLKQTQSILSNDEMKILKENKVNFENIIIDDYHKKIKNVYDNVFFKNNYSKSLYIDTYKIINTLISKNRAFKNEIYEFFIHIRTKCGLKKLGGNNIFYVEKYDNNSEILCFSQDPLLYYKFEINSNDAKQYIVMMENILRNLSRDKKFSEEEKIKFQNQKLVNNGIRCYINDQVNLLPVEGIANFLNIFMINQKNKAFKENEILFKNIFNSDNYKELLESNVDSRDYKNILRKMFEELLVMNANELRLRSKFAEKELDLLTQGINQVKGSIKRKKV